MVLILGVAAAAISALWGYRRVSIREEEAAKTSVTNVRRSASVVVTIGEAIIRLLDALQLVGRRPVTATQPGMTAQNPPMRPLIG